jgi:hypothetical protein
MSMTSTSERVRTFLDPRPARWSVVLTLSIVMAFADGFVLTSLTGAVGAIERTQGLFSTWLINSAVLSPLFLLAILFVLSRVRKRHGAGSALRTTRKVLTSILLIAIAGTVVGLAAVTASSAYDYYLQARQLDLTAPLHDQPAAAVPGDPAAAAAAAAHSGHGTGGCVTDELCDQKRETLVADMRGIGFAGPILLVTNIVLAAWLVALFGGSLSTPVRRKQQPAVASVSQAQQS